MPARRLVALLACALGLALAGCGTGSPAADAPLPPPVRPQDFPQPDGRSVGALRRGLPEGPILAPSTSVLEPGRNRFAFALFDRAHKQIEGATVVVYVGDRRGRHVLGPFPARAESLEVEPPFRSRTTASDPDAARSIYVTEIDLPRRPGQVAMALARLDGRLVATSFAPVELARGPLPPRPGDPAIRVHTPTVADVAGDLSAIDTRIPPAEDLHREDLARVLGRKPVVLLFATPQLCQSRVCGPVVDIAEQVHAATGDRAAFIFMEIYRNNRMEDGVRPQVRAWRLPTEPWAFVIDREGTVAQRFEGAFSAQELQQAVDRVLPPSGGE